MNQKKAKKLRREIAREGQQYHPSAAREYSVSDGTVSNKGLRRAYKLAKRAIAGAL